MEMTPKSENGRVVDEMTGRYKPYPAYTDSSVEWLGEIPRGWKVKRLKYLTSINSETLSEDCDPDFEMVYIDIGNVDSLGKIINQEQLLFSASPSRARRIVRDGDVIVSTVRTYLRSIAPIRNPENGTIVSTGFAVVRPGAEIDSGYSAYALRAPYFVDRIVANSKGVSFPAISEIEMATYEIAVPLISEQHAIAAFLDRETARIDALVAKNERLIKLLQEKRTALITHAVTKGLDPNVPMKDSGVEWLGEIPAHWEVKRLKRTVQIKGGGTPEKDHLEYWRGEILWVSPKDMKTAIILDTEDKITVQAVRESATKLIPSGSVLIVVRSGILIHTIPVAIAGKDVTLNQDLKAFIPNSGLIPEFLYYLISGLQKELLIEWKKEGATVESLELEFITRTPIPIPPTIEQRNITTLLDCETSRIDSLVIKVHEDIRLLREYRTAIISRAVTGKIDVRSKIR